MALISSPIHIATAFFKNIHPIIILPFIILIPCIILAFSSSRKRRVFLIDSACFKPPPSHAIPTEKFIKILTRYCDLPNETVDFVERNISKSGLGEDTCFPRGLLSEPINDSMEEGRFEAEWLLFGAVEELLKNSWVKSEDIGILVVNNTVFSVTPSLSAMIVNRFKLREDVKSYNLNGMGCSASLSAIAMVKNLLQVHKDTYALVVSTEILGPAGYPGKEHHMLFGNMLFRSGAAAILLSNRSSDRSSAKYELVHTLQTNTASSDRSYNSIFLEEDEAGIPGVSIRKDLIAVAGATLKTHIATLGRLVLPLSEQLKFAADRVARQFHVADGKPYTPNFKKGINHVICHVGGKPVLDELEKNLKFSKADMEPSRMTLYRFGNTLSSSVWYGLAYSEAKGRVMKGDRVWQVAFGSGFKCSSLVWKAIKTIELEGKNNPWWGEIDKFPVDVSKIPSFAYFHSH